MFWKKDRMERSIDGANFAVVFMIVIAISSLILNAPPPIVLYVEGCICTALLNNHMSNKRYSEYDIYAKSLKDMHDFMDNHKVEVDTPFGKMESIDDDQIEYIPDPVDIPYDKLSSRIYLVCFTIAIIVRIITIIVQFVGDTFGNIFSGLLCLIAIFDMISYIKFYRELHHMRLSYMNCYSPILMLKLINNFKKIEDQTKE